MPLVDAYLDLLGLRTAIDIIRHNNSRDFIIVDKGSEVGGT